MQITDQYLTDHILLDSYSVTNYGNDFEYKFSTNPLDYLGVDGKMLQENSYRTLVTNSAFLGAEMASSTAVLISGLNSIVSKITISTPKSKPNNNPLIYLYDRGPEAGETCDKYYEKAYVGYNEKDKGSAAALNLVGKPVWSQYAGTRKNLIRITEG